VVWCVCVKMVSHIWPVLCTAISFVSQFTFCKYKKYMYMRTPRWLCMTPRVCGCVSPFRLYIVLIILTVVFGVVMLCRLVFGYQSSKCITSIVSSDWLSRSLNCEESKRAINDWMNKKTQEYLSIFGQKLADMTWGFHSGDCEDGCLLGCSTM
jgi:hypothetical protein